MGDSFLRGHAGLNAEPGTLFGPNAFGELLVTRECSHSDRSGLLELWTAKLEDYQVALARDPASVTEYRMPHRPKATEFLATLGLRR